MEKYRVLFKLDGDTERWFAALSNKSQAVTEALEAYQGYGQQIARIEKRLASVERQLDAVLAMLSELKTTGLHLATPKSTPSPIDENKVDALLEKLSF